MGKPINWNKLTAFEKKFIAINLYNSLRGQYIVSQALSKAIDVMKEVKLPHTETSNIEDMEILHEEVFPLYQKEIMEMTPEQFKRLAKKKLKEVA